jgi:hypothetical protein
MARVRLVECSFFIPIRRDREISDGEPHERKEWKWLRHELFTRFGAGTQAPGLYQGLWESPKSGLAIAEKSRRFLIAISRREIPGLRRLLREACGVFCQQAIYLSIAGEVEFVLKGRE